MSPKFRFMKMKSSFIKDDNLLLKCATLGYFSCSYVKQMSEEKSIDRFVKKHNVEEEVSLSNDWSLKVDLVDVDARRKIISMFKCTESFDVVTVSDLLELCYELYPKLKKGGNCFVKFRVL